MSRYFSIQPNKPLLVPLSEIPVMDYRDFADEVSHLMADEEAHCVNYYAFSIHDKLKFICLIANDKDHNLHILTHEQKAEGLILHSLTTHHISFHIFEREISENFGVQFDGHHWLKPVRYAYNRSVKESEMDNYPFYSISGEELHEVGVGPVHAGVIEPGHFRFICNGEKVLHLEIQLGYQHRGIEAMMITAETGLKRSVIAESIAGDTVIGHSIGYAVLIETLAGIIVPEKLQIERAIALELERIAVHIGDMAALCGDVAYQLGQVVFESLRTTIINTTQAWCGNRFGKGLVRPGGTNYSMEKDFIMAMLQTLDSGMKRFTEMSNRIFSMPSVLSRFDGIGIVTNDQARTIGAVGMAARTCGIIRDIRTSHASGGYCSVAYEPATSESGDVLARAMIRRMEVEKSVELIRQFVELHIQLESTENIPVYTIPFAYDSLAISLTEGWRGEICHSAVTGSNGNLVHYKIKDPSMHNWLALALAVRDQEISDFPVCNKSFNLSYCGHDL
jgi:Ni,Fe-hydrogenase III large subunit